MYRYILAIALTYLSLSSAGCTAEQRKNLADEAPEAVPIIVEGGGQIATGNPVGGAIKVVGGLALIAAAIWKGPKAVQKVRQVLGKAQP